VEVSNINIGLLLFRGFINYILVAISLDKQLEGGTLNGLIIVNIIILFLLFRRDKIIWLYIYFEVSLIPIFLMVLG